MKKILVPLFAVLMLLLPQTLQAKVEHLLPKVHSLTETKGTPFALGRAVTITDADSTAALKKVFTDYGCTIADGASATVDVEMVESIEGAYDYTLEGYDNEGYQLSVAENAIVIKAVKPIGVIRAAQTLAQLAEGYEEGAAAIEAVEITDWAAFKLRGYMHDVGRSFISVAELKKHIDLLSRFKVNTFHWHFTENQAWRFEVNGYPQLTSDESMTRFAGKYYTQDECREVAQYAHERGVTIIPEIDMPGHSEAFHRAMGFDMQTDEGVDVLKEVLTQVAAVFPNAPYIHIGADEKGITYPNFLGIMADHIHGLGRKMIVWNPISGVSINSNMCDMTQMWSSRGTDIKGVPDIDCRYNYTNHFDVFADVVGIYKSNIYYADKGSEEIAGTISAYWNDRKTPTEEDIVKQNNMYANVLASAERAWIGSKVNGDKGYIEKLGTTLPNSGEVYEEFKSWEERFLFHKAHSLKNEPIPYVKQTNVRWRITDPFPNGGNSGATFAPDQYATSTNDEGLIPETFTHEGKTYYTGMATGAGIYLRHVWGNNIIPTYYGSTNHSNMTAYAWTYVYSETEQTVGAQIEFQNYGRSEHDKTPYAGKWDRKGSDIWINGTRVDPPTWVNPDTDPSNEDDLQNENFTARNPIEVTLSAGWNKVFIKLPYVGANGIRLNKWMFTCVFTDLKGKNAVEGLIYSPNQCLDEATELVAAKVSEFKRDRSNLVGTAVGLWPESAAATLDAKIAEVEATYAESKTAEERAAQITELEAAWETFVASLTADKVNLPVSGNYYRMYTPGRENRYPTSQGVGQIIIGEQNPATKASIWQFVSREDNSYDIINLSDGTYISPASGNNSALNAVAAKPNAGWVVKPVGSGKFIITSGNSVQLHQTNGGNGNKLFNWGADSNAGTFNTTDGGCVYQLVDVTAIAHATPIKQLASYNEFENGGVYTFVTERGWMGATEKSSNAISTARTNATPAADNAYFQWTVYKSRNGNYYLYNIGKKMFIGVQSANQTSVPLVATPAGKALTFKASSSTDYPIMFSTDNAGVVNHSDTFGEGLITWTGGWNTLNDKGSNHKVALITKLRDEELNEIAAIVEEYDVYEDSPLTPEEMDALRVVEKMYRPTLRVTALENGKKYMIYDTAEGRTGFIKNAGTGLGHSGTNAQSKPATFSGDESYLWAVETVDAADSKYYLKASNGKYVNATGSTDNAAGQDLYIQSWKTSTATKSNINSESEDGSITPNGEIGEGVWTISGSKVGNNGQNCWNGNSGSWAKWTDCHPYAFYDYELQASIEIPQNALIYYIAADALQSDGSYAKHYLYNNNGTLATSPNFVRDDAKYMWTATVDANGNYTFANGAGQYLGYGASGSGLCMAGSPVSLNISKENAVHGGSLGMYRIRPEGDADGQWMVTKVDGTSFNRNSAKVNNGSWCSDYTFTYINSGDRMLTIVSNVPNVEAIYSWNGEEFDLVTQLEGNAEVTDATLNCVSCNTAYTFDGFYSDEQFTQQITEVAELEDDMTVYAKFTLNIFSKNYGEKWVSVIRATNAAHAMILTDGAANTVPVYNMLDYANEGILWNFVGTAENFKIYNKVSGDALALTPNATPADGVTVKMVAATEAQNWHLIQYADGYAIAPVGNDAWGLNSYGNVAGNQVKFYGVADGGTHWNFLLQNLLSAKAEVEGWNENNPNTHFGSIKIVNGSNSALAKLKMENTAVSNIVYNGADVTIEFARAYRGFEFQGYRVGATDLGENFTLTEEIKAQITEENPLVAKFTTTDDVTLFYDDDPFSYRIPAIATTSTGRLIAVSDYRYSLDDIGRYNFGTANPGIDLVMRYSDDNGKTWSETKTIAKGSCKRGTDDCAYGDAAIAVVGEKVLVMGAAGDVMFGNGSATAHNRAVRIFSEDNGVTWTKQDISETLFLGDDATIKNGYSSFFGSGRLAVDENYNGTGKARIYGALLLKKASGTGNYVIYTDDLGLTWNILGGSQDPVANQDEPKVEILPSGQILLSVRRGGGRQFNVFTYSDKATNAGSWDSNQNGCSNGGSNTCNGEPFLVDAVDADGGAVKLLLQSQPKGGSGLYDRRNVTIWYKEITATNYTSSEIASNWKQGLQVSTQQSAYSAMALQNDGKIAFFFEEAPCYGDDQAKGYCMVYVPLTIEEITNRAYGTAVDTGIERPTGTMQDACIYDLQGRKLDKAADHGIYIVGGKKVVL